MKLSSKGFKNLKKNQQSKFLMEANLMYISSPEKDDIDSDSTEESSTKPICPFQRETKNLPKKYMEDVKKLTPFKRISHEYENLLPLCDNLNNMFDLNFNESKNIKKSSFNKQPAISNDKLDYSKKFSLINDKEIDLELEEDNYECSFLKSKCMSVEFPHEGKIRHNSILKMLQNNSYLKNKIDFDES